MPGRALRIAAAALASVLSIACGVASCGAQSQILEDVAEKGRKVDERVNDMLGQNRPDAAVVILLQYANEIEDTIAAVEKQSFVSQLEKVGLLRKLRGSERSARDHAKTLRMLSNIDARNP